MKEIQSIIHEPHVIGEMKSPCFPKLPAGSTRKSLEIWRALTGFEELLEAMQQRFGELWEAEGERPSPELLSDAGRTCWGLSLKVAGCNRWETKVQNAEHTILIHFVHADHTVLVEKAPEMRTRFSLGSQE